MSANDRSEHSHLGPDRSPVAALPGFAGALENSGAHGSESLSFRPVADGERLGIMRRMNGKNLMRFDQEKSNRNMQGAESK